MTAAAQSSTPAGPHPLPEWSGSLAVLLSIPIYLIGMNRLGAAGVAMAISISAFLQVAVLYLLWNRRSRNREAGSVYRFYIGAIVLSVPLWLGLSWLRALLLEVIDASGFRGSALLSAAVGVVFMIVFLGVGFIFDIREVRKLIPSFRKKTSRKIDTR